MSALRVTERDGITVVYFNDTKILDVDRIQQIGKELMEAGEAIGNTTSKQMLLNFQGVQVMSSAMIGKLVLLNKKSKAAGIQLKFCSIAPNVLEVFKITRFNKPTGGFGVDDDDESGTAGWLARLIPPPKNDGGSAVPEQPDDED